MRTQTDRAPRDLNEIASDQNVVKIMLLYFQKNYGFPMLRSTQNDQKSILLFKERSHFGYIFSFFFVQKKPDFLSRTWGQLASCSALQDLCIEEI